MRTNAGRIPLVAALTFVAVLAVAQGTRPPEGGGMPGPRPRVDFSTRTLPNSPTEARILDVIEDVFRNQRRGSMSVPPQDGRILRLLTETIGAKHVVEIGTSVGYSGLWIALALTSTGGKLTTFEIDPSRAAKARENFARAGVSNIVTIVEGDAHETVKQIQDPIDLLFLDADKEGYIDYLNQLLPRVRPGGLIVAHNMNERMAHPLYVQAITTNPALETVFINMETSGIGITMKKR